MRFFNFVKETFSFDYRSMALFRVLLGLMVCLDVISRLPDLTDFYTDVGIIPRALFTGELAMPWSFSLHLANGSLGFIQVMFALNFIFGLMILFGYKTRFALFCAFIMNVSVHNRNWLVNNGGDDVLRAILFYSIFLPLNKRFSLDAALTEVKTPNPHAKNDYYSSWVLVVTLQVFAIYFISYILKNHPMWRSDFTAIYYSSRLDIFTTEFGRWFRQFTGLSKFSTFVTAYLEWLGPIILIIPFGFGKKWWISRLALVVIFIGFHAGIALTMNIGLFAYICMTLWTIFLPKPFWDKLESFYKKKNFHTVTLYYDQDCGFCKKGVFILRELFLMREVKILPAQSSPEINDHMLKNNSWVIVNSEGKKFAHFNAFNEVIRHSPILRPFYRILNSKLFLSFGNWVYHWVSNNRSTMGKVTQFLVWNPEKKEVKTFVWFREIAGAFFFITMFNWQLTTVSSFKYSAPFFQNVVRWTHLYQAWNMFAPYPKLDNDWIEIVGELSDGSKIEVITGDKDIYSIKEKAFNRAVPNEHWRKFYLNLASRSDYARYFGGFTCRKWNDRRIRWVPNTTLRKMEIVTYSQMNYLNNQKGAITKKLSWTHWCYDQDYKRDNNGRSSIKPVLPTK